VGLPDAQSTTSRTSCANVPTIMRKGADWFAGIGTEKSKGTKVFALGRQGRQHRPGRGRDGHPAPRDRLRTWAAASRTARSSRPSRPAARPAGVSRTSFWTCRVDYESLAKVGFDHGLRRHDHHGRDIVDGGTSPGSSWSSARANPAVSACRAASAPRRCTTCWPSCSNKAATRDDLLMLQELCDMVEVHQPVRAGQTAPNPVMSTLKIFRGRSTSPDRRGRAIGRAATARCLAGWKRRWTASPNPRRSAWPTAPTRPAPPPRPRPPRRPPWVDAQLKKVEKKSEIEFSNHRGRLRIADFGLRIEQPLLRIRNRSPQSAIREFQAADFRGNK